MAHYAQLDSDNNVVNVFVGRDEDDLAEGVDDWENYYAIDGYTVKRCSFNTRGGVYYDPETNEPSEDQTKAFRFNYPGIGYTYDPSRDGFIGEKPYPSWVIEESSCLWVAPLPKPEDSSTVEYGWDEPTESWVALSQSE